MRVRVAPNAQGVFPRSTTQSIFREAELIIFLRCARCIEPSCSAQRPGLFSTNDVVKQEKEIHRKQSCFDSKPHRDLNNGAKRVHDDLHSSFSAALDVLKEQKFESRFNICSGLVPSKPRAYSARITRETFLQINDLTTWESHTTRNFMRIQPKQKQMPATAGIYKRRRRRVLLRKENTRKISKWEENGLCDSVKIHGDIMALLIHLTSSGRHTSWRRRARVENSLRT